ncbi:hypothetical protein [Kineosporia sp. R_H_3]|uniref:hypothetical protein n=1 Tax=Kineosporia sp. R_H_3 TaxID=1961848 RepID=UPI0013047AE7|nr:hypothetical protein [Kineosporia sp. R_H_3]
MRFLVATPVIGFVAFLAIGAVTGRVKTRSCCCPPAGEDRRLQDAAPTDRTTTTPTAAP